MTGRDEVPLDAATSAPARGGEPAYGPTAARSDSRLEQIFASALDLPIAEREAFVSAACAGDATLESDVGALLAADATVLSPLDVPLPVLYAPLLAVDDPATGKGVSGNVESPQDARVEPGRLVGPYRVVHELGRGGMGTVYLAERADGAFAQHVALKVVTAGIQSPELERRFLRERQILARLDHPGIARLLHGGLTPAGQPYLAMELVDGEPITGWACSRAIDIDARLRLFLEVCDVVSYAHRQLVVHRDLKPSNVVVTPEGSVRLLDFGIAHLLSGEVDDELRTRTGLLLLTPEYAAPEQLRGEAPTTSTDVYALGVLLFELLAERRPFETDTPSWADLFQLTQQDPPQLSKVVGPDRSRRRRLKGDLDAIVHMALQRKPERRYPSVDALADDVRSTLAHRTVRARPDRRSYRLARFAKRNAVAVAAACIILLSLAVGSTGMAWQARAAAREAAKASEISAFLTSLFELSDPDFSNGDRVTASELLDQGARRVQTELERQPEIQAEMLVLLGKIHHKLGLFERADSLLALALESRRGLRRDDHPDVAAVLASIGTLRADQGRLGEAEQLLREAVRMREARLGGHAPDLAPNLRDLASVLATTGTYDEAESLARRALDIDVQSHGPRDAEVARDLEVLYNVLYAKGDYDGGIAIAQRTLDVRREVLGDQHLETATAKNDLAVYKSEIGALDEAESLYREVLAFDIERLGEVHPYTATVTNNLASILRRKGDLDQAESLYRRVLELDIRLFGDVHPYVATVMGNLADVQRERGELAESETLLRGALAMFRELLGENHASVGRSLARLAETRYRQGAAREADSLFVEGLDRLRAAFPDGHAWTASALLGRGQLLAETNREAEGEPLLREALAIREHSLGPDDVSTAEARRALGDCLVGLARFGEAESMLTQAWASLETKPYATRQRQVLASSLASLYERVGRPDDASSYRRLLASQLDGS